MKHTKTGGRIEIKKINLRDYYPFLRDDCFVVVSDEIVAVFEESKRKEKNYRRKKYWNRAHYSLDRDDGIEHDAVFISVSPQEIYERKLTKEELYSAILKLPSNQAKRIYAHFFFNMSKTEIAKAEGVSVMAISKSISLGLKTLEKELKNFSY